MTDVGANVGSYAVWAAKRRGCRVIACEPESLNYAELNKNIHINGVQHLVRAFCVGISDTPDITDLYLSRFVPSFSHHDVGEARREGPVTKLAKSAGERHRQGIMSVRLDWLLPQMPNMRYDHLKIDVDGLEHKVIAGAEKVGKHKTSMLQDIAVLTGGQVITEEMGRKLDTTQLHDLGQAEKVISTKEDTTIVGIEDENISKEILGRINQIKAEIEASTSDYDKEKLQERLAKLSGGVAIIRVGAGTEVELKEKKHRVEDALSATRAAVEEGIVPGGGVALINAIPALDEIKMEFADEQTGVTIVRRALEEPMRQLAMNAGKDGAVIVDNVRRIQKEKGDNKLGFDVLRDEYPNMLKAGIIDPVKVTRSAVENAASIGAMILTTEALVTDIPEEEKAPAAPPMPEY